MKYNYEDLKEAARYTRISMPSKYFSSREEMVKDFNRWADYGESLINYYRAWVDAVCGSEE